MSTTTTVTPIRDRNALRQDCGVNDRAAFAYQATVRHLALFIEAAELLIETGYCGDPECEVCPGRQAAGDILDVARVFQVLIGGGAPRRVERQVEASVRRLRHRFHSA